MVTNMDLRKACNCALCVDEMTRKPLLDPKIIPLDIKAEKIELDRQLCHISGLV